MLYASGDGFRRERGYIVRLLRDGARSDAVSFLIEKEVMRCLSCVLSGLENIAPQAYFRSPRDALPVFGGYRISASDFAGMFLLRH